MQKLSWRSRSFLPLNRRIINPLLHWGMPETMNSGVLRRLRFCRIPGQWQMTHRKMYGLQKNRFWGIKGCPSGYVCDQYFLFLNFAWRQQWGPNLFQGLLLRCHNYSKAPYLNKSHYIALIFIDTAPSDEYLQKDGANKKQLLEEGSQVLGKQM